MLSKPFTRTSRKKLTSAKRQAIGIIGIIGVGLVGSHVERSLGVARIDANHRQALRRQRVKELAEWAVRGC